VGLLQRPYYTHSLL
jgi:hypothetical protein